MDYKEMAEIVKSRGDQIIAEKQARNARIKKISSAAAGVCAAAAAAFAIWNGGILRNATSEDFKEHGNIIASDDTVNATENKTTAPVNKDHTITTAAAESTHTETASSAAGISIITTHSSVAEKTGSSPAPVTTAKYAANSKPTVATAVYASNSTPAATTAVLSEPEKNTDITYEPITPEEGKIMIKQFLAALAAASTMNNAAAVSTSPIVRFEQDNSFSSTNQSYYDKFDSGELNADLNGDGTFDVYDAFAAFICKDMKRSDIMDDNGKAAQFFTREQRMNIVGMDSFDENGELISPSSAAVSFEFSAALNNYHLLKNGIILSDYDVNNFRTLDGKFTPESWYAPGYCSGLADSISMRYEFTERYDAENNVDFDFNADGTVDIKDCIDYCVFEYYISGQSAIYYTHISELDQYENAYYSNHGWMLLHHIDALAGRESADGISVPAEYYVQQMPLKETTIKNCAEYALSHPYNSFLIGGNNSAFMIKHFMNNYEFSEEWLDPQFCYDYLLNSVTESGFTDDFTMKMIKDMSGINGYGYRYMGEARVIAIESGLVNYNDYCDILSWHYSNPNYLKYNYAMYEQAIANGEIAEPDIDGSGRLDEMDLTILGILYRYENTYRAIDENFSDYIKRCFSQMYFFNWEPDIEFLSKHFDCNNNGLSCDSSDALFAGLYVAKHGNIDPKRDDYNHNLFTYAESIIRAIPNGLYDDKTPEPAFAPVPTDRTGDASDDGVLKMNDAVLIMQSISNPDKYQLNSRGEFNADIYNTGDGITPNDALEVQRTLLHEN